MHLPAIGEPQAKTERVAGPFCEISESKPQAQLELSEKNYLSKLKHYLVEGSFSPDITTGGFLE